MATTATKETTELSLVILGGGGVGKSCITVQFVSHSWDKTENYDPTIEDTFRKTVQVDNMVIHLTVLDTAGQDEFAALVKDSMVKADGFILVYDLTNVGSFQKLKDFVTLFTRIKDNDIQKLSSDTRTKSKNSLLPFVLVGNKLDLIQSSESARKITSQMAQDFAINILAGQDLHDEPAIDPKSKKPLPIQTFPILESSAKNRTNIDSIFEEGIRQALKWRKYIQELNELSSTEAAAPPTAAPVQKSEQQTAATSNSPTEGHTSPGGEKKKEGVKSSGGFFGMIKRLKSKKKE